jgi:UDP-N-acetylglucosamine:LPS N-acetylglucosamine transferase
MARTSPRPSGARTKALLVCSAGGHLLLLHQLRTWWKDHDRVWVSFRKVDAESILRGERVVWAFHPTQRHVGNLLRNARLAWTTVRRERPDVLVSTGAGVALPFFVVAKLHRVRTVYVEAYERIDSASLTGRLCYPLSDLFILQWEEQRRFYPKGELVGALI